LERSSPQVEPDADRATAAEASRRTTTVQSPAWSRLVLPSVADLIFVVLLAAFAFGPLTSRLLEDAGTGWHILDGERILNAHAITRTDPFSSTMGGHPWYAWEWLYDLIVGAIHAAAGLNGVVLFTAVVIAFAFALTFQRARERGTSVPVAVLLLVLAVFASAIHFFARPHVLSWVFAIIWFEILDRSESSGDVRPLYWLPVLTLLWVNVHGGFLLGFALLGIYFVAACIGWAKAKVEREPAGRWVKSLAITTGVCALATFANPYGYHLHAHIYQYLSDRFLMNHIQEFRSPDFHGMAQQCFAILLLITLVALATVHGKLRASHLLVIVFAAYSGLYAARNIPISSILLVLLVGPVLSKAAVGLVTNPRVDSTVRRWASRTVSFDLRMSVRDKLARGHLWPILFIVLGTVASLHAGRIGSYRLMDAHFSAPRFPVQAVTLIQEKGIHEPIFAPDYWGGYLLYRLYPDNKVIIDDRHDLYGDEILRDYLKVTNIQPGWDDILRQMGANWVLMPEDSSLANMLNISPGWELAYSDKIAALYHRKLDLQK
jgi:hypothetical protein